MSRLIDADYLSEEFDNRCPGECDCCGEYTNSKSGCKVIDDAPTVDAVPVVRCKDCRRQTICYHSEDYFCADGEKVTVCPTEL